MLAAGVGYCNTKATSFIAMLRPAGIPAHQRFVTLGIDGANRRVAALRGGT